MTSPLSDWATGFLREDHVGVVGTLNSDGSPHLTTMWYLLADDSTVIMTTLSRNQKVQNLRRDPRMTFCVGDKTRSVSLSGHVTISDDQTVVREDLERLVERYVNDEDTRPQLVATWMHQPHVALHFRPEKVTEFSVSPMR
jgi:PPOX class probable F420-dependent enzyme